MQWKGVCPREESDLNLQNLRDWVEEGFGSRKTARPANKKGGFWNSNIEYSFLLIL